MIGDMDEFRRSDSESRKLKEKMAYEMLVKNGHEWLRVNGQQKLQEAIETLKVNIRVWNKLTGSTMPFSLQTIDVMLQQLSAYPFVIGMDIIKRTEYVSYCHSLSAVRNHLIKERDDRIRKADQISTDESGGALPTV